MVTLSFSQEQEKILERSNDYIYEANKIVNEDFITAEMEYRKAVSVKPDNAIGNYNLGNAYFKSGLLDEALLRHIEAAEHASTKEERYKAFHNVGNVLMQQNQCKKAVEAYKNALRNNPSDDETRYNLALAKECADKQGESDDGEKDQKEDQKNEENKDQENKDDKNKDQNDQDQENNDEGDKDEDKKDGDDKKDDKGNPKDQDKNKKGNSNDKKNQQPQQGKLSPQQVKNLLEAMNNEEKKVQDKINAKKAKGVKIKTEKDW
ncbi:MAG: tetratricopeptide repeat protein [Flavobacteriaceae bacterium]|nr:tetratricopeptide repeat protein [Flavobacteriaceae bacterium]